MLDLHNSCFCRSPVCFLPDETSSHHSAGVHVGVMRGLASLRGGFYGLMSSVPLSLFGVNTLDPICLCLRS